MTDPTPVSAPEPQAAPTAIKPWESKTMWVSALVAILPLVPGVGPAVAGLIGTNPEIATALLGAVFGGLRLISHGKVTISPK